MKNKLEQIGISLFHSKTVFKQLVLFTVVTSLFPIILISIFLFKKIDSLVTDDLVKSHSQVVAQYKSNIDDKFFQYQGNLNQIANNTIILNTLLDKADTKNPYMKGRNVSIEVNKSLNLANNNELRNCMIYSNVEDSKIYGLRVAMIDGASREKWYINHKDFNENFFASPSKDKKYNILSLIKNIEFVDIRNFNSQNVGFIKLDINMDELFAPTTITDEESYVYDVIILNEEDNVVYTSDSSNNHILSDLSLDQLQIGAVNYYENLMVFRNTLDEYDLDFVFIFNSSQLLDKKAEIYQSILPIIFIIIGIIVITAFVFTRGFSKRVAKLVHKIKVAETGDLTITEEIEGNDEIAVLDKQFNQMLLKLENLINMNYIQEIEKKETEFRNLQLQINPHFLYNTLETISSIAAVKQVFIISDICKNLGNIFRYSLGKNYGNFVTVKLELEHIKNYVYIQKTRFGSKFDVFYYVEPQIEENKILRFILQPIVENAISHGLSHITRKGNLEISIRQEKDRLVIKIEDDGIGMSVEKVDELLEYINYNKNDTNLNEKLQSIGIRNVNQRIKLACGDGYGIKIESIQNQGSCFILSLPLIPGGGI